MSDQIDAILKDIAEFKEQVDERFTAQENLINDLFFSLMASRLSKKLIEEVIELSVVQYFKVDRMKFVGKRYVKEGRKGILYTEDDKRIILARNWYLSFVHYVLLKKPENLRQSVFFFHTTKLNKFKPIWMGAVDPKTAKDKANRKILKGIIEMVQSICDAEGIIIHENFKYIE